MRKLIYRLRCALYMKKRVEIPFRAAWDVSGSLVENEFFDAGYSYKDAVDEELSYWSD